MVYGEGILCGMGSYSFEILFLQSKKVLYQSHGTHLIIHEKVNSVEELSLFLTKPHRCALGQAELYGTGKINI